MALAPLRSGPHTVRADRLAFAVPVPVREAGGAGHWITIGGSDDAEGEGHGGVHIFISGAGAIEKGPRSLVGQHVAAIAHHPAAGKLKHHPAGHEPPGARDHPHYAEAPANAERQTPSAGQEPAKRPGKPYARLHGADQGTRHEQIGKALGAAQDAARGAKAAKGQDRVADTAVAHQQAQAELAAHRAAHDRNPNPWAPHLSPPVGDAKDKELAEKATRAQLAHQAAQAQQQGAQQQQQQEGQRAHEKEMVRLKAETAQPKPAFTAPQPQAKDKPQAAPQPGQRQTTAEAEHAEAMRGLAGHFQQLAAHNRATMSPQAQRIEAQTTAAQTLAAVGRKVHRMTADEYITARHAHERAQLEREGPLDSPEARARSRQRLAEHGASPNAARRKELHGDYLETVKRAIKGGEHVPEHVLAQHGPLQRSYEGQQAQAARAKRNIATGSERIALGEHQDEGHKVPTGAQMTLKDGSTLAVAEHVGKYLSGTRTNKEGVSHPAVIPAEYRSDFYYDPERVGSKRAAKQVQERQGAFAQPYRDVQFTAPRGAALHVPNRASEQEEEAHLLRAHNAIADAGNALIQKHQPVAGLPASKPTKGEQDALDFMRRSANHARADLELRPMARAARARDEFRARAHTPARESAVGAAMRFIAPAVR